MFSLLMFLVAMFFLVGVHEYGHFIVARKTGIKVDEFFIGFGPTVFSWIGKDDVKFGLKLIPLGGYVKMSGESPEKATGLPDDYFSQPVWKRISVAFAGPLFNFIFAIVLFVGLGIHGIKVTPPVVGFVDDGSISKGFGLKAGDVIKSIDGNEINSWRDINRYFQESDGKSWLEFEQNGKIIKVKIEVKSNGKDALMTLFPDEVFGFHGLRTLTITSIDNDSSASYSELKKGYNIYKIIKSDGIASVTYSIHDDSERLVAKIDTDKEGMIGLRMAAKSFADKKVLDMSIYESIKYGFSETYYMSKLNILGVYKLIVNDISVKNISGPIMIADYAGKTASMGLDTFIFFLAAISVALGIMNLLPIPALDGGLIVMYIVEGIRGKAINQKTMEGFFKLGYGLLFCLISIAMYNDFVKYIL